MKKIYSLFLIALTLGFASCTNEVDDLFGKQSAQRMADAIANTTSVLQSAEDGWLMEFYGDDKYGGYNLVCKFDADSVVIYNELAEEPQTSHYRVDQSQGVILSFDAYNENIHFFSDPASGVGQKGEGMMGDFEFRVQSVSNDSIVLIGKKHGKKVVMTPFHGSFDAYAEALDSIDENMFPTTKYYLIMGKDTVSMSLSDGRCFVYANENGISKNAPFIVTTTGLKFASPIVIGGKTISGFNYSETEAWTAIGDNTVVLAAHYPSLAESFCDGMWFFSGDMMSEAVAQVFATSARTLKAKEGESFGFALLGNISGDFYFYISSTNGSQSWAGVYGFNVKVVDDNTITIAYNGTKLSSGNYYYKYVENVIELLGGTEGRTYTLAADDPLKPKYFQCTATDDPSVYFYLSSEQVLYPFGK